MDLIKYQDLIVKHRSNLHQIPELGFDLPKTHAYVKKELQALGYQIYVTAKTGIIAYQKGLKDDAVAFRSDMDALSVLEQTKHAYPSLHHGQMHACGHDGHMALLLAFAAYVKTLKNLSYSVVFIFQPAEEGPGGAKVIVDDGMLEKFHVKKIFGMHVFPHLNEGVFGLKEGPMLARNGEFEIMIKGQSGHAAQPHLGKDALVIASKLIIDCQTIVSRMINPIEPAVITFGKMIGGEARNIIAKDCFIQGTIRAFDDNVYQKIKHQMEKLKTAYQDVYDIEIDMQIIDYYPTVFNDSALFHHIKSLLDDTSYDMLDPLMFSEDFAFYQQKVPGMFLMLGVRNEQKGFIHPLHSCYFDFEPKVLIKGFELYQNILNHIDLFFKAPKNI